MLDLKLRLLNPIQSKDYHTKASGDAGRAVAGAESIVLALASLRESCQPGSLPHCVHLVSASGQNLVWVCLQRHENVERVMNSLFILALQLNPIIAAPVICSKSVNCQLLFFQQAVVNEESHRVCLISSF